MAAVKPKIIFAGTPDFAVPSLYALAQRDDIELIAVYTQPDRPAGRGRRLTASAVKEFALEHGLRIEQEKTLRDAGAQQKLAALNPDLMIVAAYGLILPQAVLDIPRLGCVNVHASLLPRWRGAAPVQRAIIAGDQHTGVTLMQMNAGLDTGDMLALTCIDIQPGETGGMLTDRLAQLGGDLLDEQLASILGGRLESQAQDDSLATLAPKIQKKEARINWQEPAELIALKVRAFNPWPVADTTLNGQQLRVWAADAQAGGDAAAPGTVISDNDEYMSVSTGDGVLLIHSLQPAGKRVMAAQDFLNAHDVAGARLGSPDGDC
ncbi:MAG: methionyl-tRNA formyltransferase [Gammaproteobacteria bacterium]|nr:methionyl-tRNA formyltransferase [Gammaproteobacteria bacterium]